LGTFAVAREWTNHGSSSEQSADNALILDYQSLLALKEILGTLAERKKKVDK
jgi:hypothetical protein